MSEQTLTHVVGTFLIQAEGAFLNGAGLGAGADRNMTVPKTFSDFRDRVPYVSAQAWKRWLRATFQEENPDEPATVLRQLPGGTGARGQTTKIGTDPTAGRTRCCSNACRAICGLDSHLYTEIGLGRDR